ncbi:MAG TPA: DsrE family protein [bacterium]|nr:DsrE family protein [bacterium]
MEKIIIMCLIATLLIPVSAQKNMDQKKEKDNCCSEKNSIVLLWTSQDPEVFLKVVYPYALNSKKHNLWENVELLIWGPSTRLLSKNKELQDKVVELKEKGVVLTSCKWCAEQYGVSGRLEKMGVKVKYMGKPLTNYIKSGREVLVF